MFEDLELQESAEGYLEQLHQELITPLSGAEQRRLNSVIAVPSTLPKPEKPPARERRRIIVPGPSGRFGEFGRRESSDVFSSVSSFPSTSGFGNQQDTFGLPRFCEQTISWTVEEPNTKLVTKGFRTWQNAMVTFINDSTHFYAQIGELGEYTKELAHRLNKVYKRCSPDRNECEKIRDPLNPPSVSPNFVFDGRVVAAQWNKDNFWYRAVVVGLVGEALSEDSIVQVQMLDYGDKHNCKVKDLRPLHSDFAEFPPAAVRCYLEITPPFGGDHGLDCDTFSDNLKRKFGGESICSLFLTGETEECDGEVAYSVRLGDKGKNDCSAELLRPPSDPVVRLNAEGQKQPEPRGILLTGCVMEVRPKIGRLILDDTKWVMAFFDTDTVSNSMRLGDFTADLKSEFGPGDTVETVCQELAGSEGRVFYCTAMKVVRRAQREDFCDDHVVPIEVREGQYAIAQSTIQEKVLILPEGLLHDTLLKKLMNFRVDRTAVRSVNFPSFSDLVVPYRTLSVTTIPVPHFVSDRCNLTGKVVRPGMKFALEVRPSGDVRKGIGRIVAHYHNGFKLMSVSDQELTEEIWAPRGILGRLKDALLQYRVGAEVAYEVAEEMPDRAFKWRAFNLSRNFEPELKFLKANEQRISGKKRAVDNPPVATKSPLLDLQQANDVMVIDEGINVGDMIAESTTTDEDSAQRSEHVASLTLSKEPQEPTILKRKTLEELLNENIDKLSMSTSRLPSPSFHVRGSEEPVSAIVKAEVPEKLAGEPDAVAENPNNPGENIPDNTESSPNGAPNCDASVSNLNETEHTSETDKRRNLVLNTLNNGSEDEKNAIKILAQKPDLFRQLFQCDPSDLSL